MVQRTQVGLTHLVKEAVLLAGKSVTIAKTGSNIVKYICSDVRCNWRLCFVRDNVTQTRTQEECMYHVSKNSSLTDLTHSIVCVSAKKPSCLQLENMAAMKVVVAGDPQCKARAMKTATQHEGVVLDNRKSTMYQARNNILLKNDMEQIKDGFQGVEAFMPEYMRMIPGSKCTLKIGSCVPSFQMIM